MKTPSTRSALFAAFSILVCAGPQAAFSQFNARASISPAVLPTFSHPSMTAPAHKAASPSATLSIVTGILPLAASNIPRITAPIQSPRALVKPAMTDLASGGSRFAASAQVGAGAKDDRQISEAMFAGAAERNNQSAPSIVNAAATEQAQEETSLNQALADGGIKFPTAATPYAKLAALYENAKDVVSKNALIGWHAGRFFMDDKPRDAQHGVIVGADIDEVKDGGPLFGKALHAAFLNVPVGEKAEALSPKAITELKDRLIYSLHTLQPSGNNVMYDWTTQALGIQMSAQVQIRKNGRYLVIKEEVTRVVPSAGKYYIPGTYKHTTYAYFFKDVTPQAADSAK